VTALKARFAGILILTFILNSILPLSTRGVDYREVNATTSEAEQTIAAGFEAALDAEQAGANVSSLLAKLNEGADYLSAARMAFEYGNYSEADQLSDLSREVGAQVESEALILRTEASNAAVNKYRLYLVSSAVAIVIVLLATLLGYRFLKKRYFEHLLKMKPEVETA
jgi:uncharacterized protein YfcZ (UPF0381/DUF406 family)